MPTQPVLFISHGSPMWAVEPGIAGPVVHALAKRLPRPDAILAISPHWEAPIPAVVTAAKPETIHDFGGFPPVLYTLQYTAPGAPVLAARVAGLLKDAGVPVHNDAEWGLDHGTWVPLRYMYPDADIPVTQLAMQPRIGPQAAYALGKLLEPLRDDNVLIFGSGSITHNLREIFRGPGFNEPQPYVAEFVDWIADRIAAHDLDALFDYRVRAPHAVRAHPTDEHLMPLYYALGAAGDDWNAERIDGGVTNGVLSMDGFLFGSTIH